MRAALSLRVPRMVKVVVGSLAGLLVALTAVIGFAHTRPGRPLLAWLGKTTGFGVKSGGCPLGYDRAATPQQREAQRAHFAASHGGTERAARRPALGFTLDHTTRDDVTAWAKTHGVACAAGTGPADLSCDDVPDALVPGAFRGVGHQSVWFTFGAQDRLVSVITVAQASSPDPVEATFAAITRDLDRETGAASHGDTSADAITKGLLYQASAEYRFRDYYAVMRATNVGQGFALTEEYRSLPD